MGFFDLDRTLSISAEIYEPDANVVTDRPIHTLTSNDIYSFNAPTHLSGKAPYLGETASTQFKMSVTLSSLSGMFASIGGHRLTVDELELTGYKIVPIINCNGIAGSVGMLYIKRISAAEQVELINIEGLDAIGWLFNGKITIGNNETTWDILGRNVANNTFASIFARLCDHVGATPSGDIYDTMLPANGMEVVKYADIYKMLEGREMTFRDLLGYLAAFGGGYARANLVGNIEIKQITASPVYTVTPDDYFSYTSKAESKLDIKHMRYRYAFDTNDEEYPRLYTPSSVTDPVTTVNVAECACPFISKASQASAIYWKIASKVFESGSLDFRGDPSLMAGGAVRVRDLNGVNHTLMASSLSLSFNNGGFRMTVNSDMPEKTIAEYADSIFDAEGFVKPTHVRGIKTPAVNIGRGGIMITASNGAALMEVGLESATVETSTPSPLNQLNVNRITADNIVASNISAKNVRPFIESGTFEYPETSWEQFLTKIVPSAEWGELTYNVKSSVSAAMANKVFDIPAAHVHRLVIRSNSTGTRRLAPSMRFNFFTGNCSMRDLKFSNTKAGNDYTATPLTLYYGGSFYLQDCVFIDGYNGIRVYGAHVAYSNSATDKGFTRSYFISATQGATVYYTGNVAGSGSTNNVTHYADNATFIQAKSVTVQNSGGSASASGVSAAITADIPLTMNATGDYTGAGEVVEAIRITAPSGTINTALLTFQRVAGIGSVGDIDIIISDNSASVSYTVSAAAYSHTVDITSVIKDMKNRGRNVFFIASASKVALTGYTMQITNE